MRLLIVILLIICFSNTYGNLITDKNKNITQTTYNHRSERKKLTGRVNLMKLPACRAGNLQKLPLTEMLTNIFPIFITPPA
ncbi:MAG: hypothetical protein GW771_13820 [Flavobacteriia bacterium]|nr:hypothetical protein [Flavobacteriia bacterium]